MDVKKIQNTFSRNVFIHTETQIMAQTVIFYSPIPVGGSKNGVQNKNGEQQSSTGVFFVELFAIVAAPKYNPSLRLFVMLLRL